MIKRILAFIVPVVIIVCCSGCVVANFTIQDYQTILGSGQMKSTDYQIGEYTEIEVKCNSEMELYYTAAQSDKVTIEIQENLAEYLKVSVENGVLVVESDKRFRTDSDKTPKLYISTPTLKRIKVEGALSIKQADTIKVDSFRFDIGGAADGVLVLDTGKLDFGVAGACDLTFSGKADEAYFAMSGAGTINAMELQSKQSDIMISGAGTISVNSSDTLNINVSGTGSVNYKGDPKVTQDVGGAVSIKRVD